MNKKLTLLLIALVLLAGLAAARLGVYQAVLDLPYIAVVNTETGCTLNYVRVFMGHDWTVFDPDGSIHSAYTSEAEAMHALLYGCP